MVNPMEVLPSSLDGAASTPVIAAFLLDRASPVPLYYQVAQYLEEAIEDGRMPPGTQLDNELQLADQLGLSRPTLRRALQYLVEKGLLVRRRGVGTRVVQPKVRRPVELSSLYDDLVAQRAATVHRGAVLNTMVPASARDRRRRWSSPRARR